MSSEDSKPDKEADKDGGKKSPSQFLNPAQADHAAENEFKKKYGIRKAPPGIAQRKISATGGKQYFDSGDYMSANRQDRQAIASHPHAMNPHLAHMRAKAVVHKVQPSKLAAGTAKSPLAH